MGVRRHLEHSPALADVARAMREFSARYGTADLFFAGKITDPEDEECYKPDHPVPVARLLPSQGKIILDLLDGFVPWGVRPTRPYQFELRQREPSASPPSNSDINTDEIEWLDDFRPYAGARCLGSIEAMLRSLGFQEPIAAPQEGSITAQFRGKQVRCGVYVLHFADGAYYAGQTVEIVKRFGQHRRNHPDIIRLSFRPLAKKQLNFHEAQLIRLLETSGFRLRNIDMTSVLSVEPGDFDELMDAPTQERWLRDPSFVALGTNRDEQARRVPMYSERYEDLKSRRQYRDVFTVVQSYVRNGIPAVAEGEASYWQASVLPPGFTVLARINVNWQEVFFANTDADRLFFYLIVSKRELQRHFGDDLAGLEQRYPTLEWEDTAYRAGGGDQVAIFIPDAAAALRFVRDPAVIPAIRHFNLRLMKRGKSPWGKSHNFDLVDDILRAQR